MDVNEILRNGWFWLVAGLLAGGPTLFLWYVIQDTVGAWWQKFQFNRKYRPTQQVADRRRKRADDLERKLSQLRNVDASEPTR